MINQFKMDCLPAEEIAVLDAELKSVQDESQALAIELRNASAGKPIRLVYLLALKTDIVPYRTGQSEVEPY